MGQSCVLTIRHWLRGTWPHWVTDSSGFCPGGNTIRVQCGTNRQTCCQKIAIWVNRKCENSPTTGDMYSIFSCQCYVMLLSMMKIVKENAVQVREANPLPQVQDRLV